MRTLSPLLVMLLLCTSLQGFAQGFHSVHSPNGVVVWAVGTNGTIYRSFDGGATWGNFSDGSTTFRSVFTLAQYVWLVGDNGTYRRSVNGGGSWSSGTLAGGVRLNAVAFASPSVGWIAGHNGTLLGTTDGGVTWTEQVSGTAQNLNAIAAVDAQNAYVAGAAGTLLKTTDGGASWASAAGVGWTRDIFSVSARGSHVYAVGALEFSVRSTNGGGSWSALNFKTDSRSDVHGVFAHTPDSVRFIGGGGAIRVSTDGGSTFTWGLHGMHAQLSSIYFYDALRGWASSPMNYAVLSTTDGGLTWSLPSGTTVTRQWVQKFSAGSIGNTFMIDPFDRDKIWVIMGNSVYLSTNRGETWVLQAGKSAGGGSCHSFYISPKNPNLWVVAATGTTDAVRRSTNAGVSWTTSIAANFTSYGMPLEMDSDRPDTLYFAPDGSGGTTPNARFYCSKDFGLTWDTVTITRFRSPCDILLVPDNPAIIYVADGVTGTAPGKMWRSPDAGRSWDSIYAVSGSEIPMMAMSRHRTSYAYATAWGSGGYWKTTNTGLQWSPIAGTSSTWGTDVAKDDPNVVLYGTYGGGTAYLSTNAGTSFISSPLSGSNSGMLCYDRATLLVHQAGNGVWKYSITYTVPTVNAEVLVLLTPSGGESWQYNSSHSITWTAANLTNVRIELQTTAGGVWQTIAASVPASAGSHPWTIPNQPTTEARIRISDASDSSPVDSSGVFSIVVPGISPQPAAVAFGGVSVGSSAVDTVRLFNTGTGTLVISSVTTSSSRFVAGRTSFSIPAGQSDTLSVVFLPDQEQTFEDTLVLMHNAPTVSLHVPLSGSGITSAPVLLSPANGATAQPASVTLQWDTVAGGTSYHVQLATSATFATLIVNDSLAPSTSREVGLLAGNATYYWRVRGKFGGQWTSWSSPWSFTTASQVTAQYEVQEGWNILSLPMIVDDPRKELVLPTAASGAFSFSPSEGYIIRDSLENSVGYWVKFNAAEMISLTGQVSLRDTVAVGAGWNLIGTVAEPIAVGWIQEVPAGIVASAFYGYEGAYAPVDTLHPFRGYWVKANQQGLLVMDVTPAHPTRPAGKQAARAQDGGQESLTRERKPMQEGR